MNEFNFTFGCGHHCPETGHCLNNRYVQIIAEREDDARALMKSRYKDQWASGYTKEQFKQYPNVEKLVLHRFLRVSTN